MAVAYGHAAGPVGERARLHATTATSIALATYPPQDTVSSSSVVWPRPDACVVMRSPSPGSRSTLSTHPSQELICEGNRTRDEAALTFGRLHVRAARNRLLGGNIVLEWLRQSENLERANNAERRTRRERQDLISRLGREIRSMRWSSCSRMMSGSPTCRTKTACMLAESAYMSNCSM